MSQVKCIQHCRCKRKLASVSKEELTQFYTPRNDQ